MPSFMIDNTPANYRFKDGNPLSDGIASFHASLLNAGPAVAEARRVRERDAVGDAFRSSDDQRANKALELQQLWHDQTSQRADRNYDTDLAAKGYYEGQDPALRSMAIRQRQSMEQAMLEAQEMKARIDHPARSGYSPVVDNVTGDKYSFDRSTGQFIPFKPGTGPIPPGQNTPGIPPAGAPAQGAPNAGAAINNPLMAPLSRAELQRMDGISRRVTATLRQPGFDPAQAKRLTDAMSQAQIGDPAAIRKLIRWEDAQEDAVQAQEQNQNQVDMFSNLTGAL